MPQELKFKELKPVQVGGKSVSVKVTRLPRPGGNGPHVLGIVAEFEGQRSEGTMTFSHEHPHTNEGFDAALRKRCEELAREVVGHHANGAHFDRLFAEDGEAAT